MNEFWNGKVYTFFSLSLKSNFIFQNWFLNFFWNFQWKSYSKFNFPPTLDLKNYLNFFLKSPPTNMLIKGFPTIPNFLSYFSFYSVFFNFLNDSIFSRSCIVSQNITKSPCCTPFLLRAFQSYEMKHCDLGDLNMTKDQ